MSNLHAYIATVDWHRNLYLRCHENNHGAWSSRTKGFEELDQWRHTTSYNSSGVRDGNLKPCGILHADKTRAERKELVLDSDIDLLVSSSHDGRHCNSNRPFPGIHVSSWNNSYVSITLYLNHEYRKIYTKLN